MSVQKPTEAGRYLDAFGNTWRLWNDGQFAMLGNSDADPERYGPWKKLVVAEEPEWEKRYEHLKSHAAVAMVTLNGDPYGYRSPSNREAAELLASGLEVPVKQEGAETDD